MTELPDTEVSQPTGQGPLLDEITPSRWPTVIGVISIIYAIGGMTCATLQVGWLAVMDAIPEMYRGGITMPLGLRLAMIGLVVPLLILGIMLITGGIGLLRRKRSSVSLLRKWVLLRLVMLLLGVMFAVVTAPAQIEITRQSHEFAARMYAESGQSAPPSKSDEELWRGLILQTGIFSALIAIYPLFIGFYLSRRRINDEVAEWR
jgi:uncharacterized membrane protein